MVADTATWNDGDLILGRRHKIARFPDGWLFAACGDDELINAYVRWKCGDAERPPPIDRPEDFLGILVHPDRPDCPFWVGGRTYEPELVGLPYAAAGGAVEFLYGALSVGATAEEAVSAALRHHASAAGELQVERLEPAPSG